MKTATMTRSPIFKCPGGKSWALGKIREMAPKKYKRYVEPFVGGGAVFLNLASEGLIYDANPDITDTWIAVMEHPEALMATLDQMPISRDYYYELREASTADMNVVEIAARFIYLNKCGFNGLIRYNKQGKWNVPFGRHKRVVLYSRSDILAAHQHLQRFGVANLGYSYSISHGERGDFFFIDPPYDQTFGQYTSGGFGTAQQINLASKIHALDARGGKFLLTNSNTELIRSLYRDFKQEVVPTRYSIAADTSDRKVAKEELFITNY